MNLISLLDNHAHTKSNRIAIKDRVHGVDRALTYKHLHQLTRESSGRLLQAGVRKGDRVLLMVPLSLETFVILLAVFRIGAIAVIADSSNGLIGLAKSIETAKPKALIASRIHLIAAHAFNRTREIEIKLDYSQIAILGTKLFIGRSKASDDADRFELARGYAKHPVELDDEHPALITFTSGSTAQAKAIVRSHGFLLHQQNVIASSMPGEEDDVELTTLPTFVLSALARGITSVIPDCDMRKPADIDARRIVSQIDKCKINRIIASPAFLQKLTEFAHKKKEKLTTVKTIFTGGGPVFPHLLKQCSAVFPKAELNSVYGSTEAEPIAHINSRDLAGKDIEKSLAGGGLLAGKPIDEIALAIIDPKHLDRIATGGINGVTEKLPVNTPGEIVVSGNHVIQSYLNGQGNAQTKVFLNIENDVKLWHRTGDAGYLDENGRLWLLGRSASKISDDWGDVYPFQVEVAASEIQCLKRATCLNADGKRILVVEKREPLQIGFAVSFLRAMHAAFNWLHFDEIRVVSEIPVDARHNSKIRYQALSERLNATTIEKWAA